MPDLHRQAIIRFANEVGQLPNESAKTHRFSGLVSELFPGSNAVVELARGTEKAIRITSNTGRKRGRIDAYYGNAIIEFERSLEATLADAEFQLRKYTAGVWTEHGQRVLICIASDGTHWRTYRPVRAKGSGKKVTAEDVRLELLRTITLDSRGADEFLFWLTSLLFREGQRRPTTEAFRFDFGAHSLAYNSAKLELQSAWKQSSTHSESELKLDTWKRYLTFTYGSVEEISDLAGLFLRHTYLACVSRLLVWAAMSHGKTTRPLRDAALDVFDGTYFRQHGLRNLVEDDFFSWVTDDEVVKLLAPTWERIVDQILTYDLSDVGNDILKGIYQELVDPVERHDLGEYYTPDWLCEAVVNELVPATGYVRVLDPTCGSGSFLRAAIAKLLKQNQDGGDTFRLNAILNHVAGIEIHPLAVTIARATYALALGPLLKDLNRPIQIPVYLADSLFLPVEVEQLELGEARSYEIRFGGDEKVRIPEALVQSADMFDSAIDAATEIAEALATGGKESKQSLGAYVRKEVPGLVGHHDEALMLAALWDYAERLSTLMRHKKDSIWSFVVRNAYKPAMLRGSFDVIVGNPPWLSYRYIKDPEYQAEVKKRAVEEYQIAPRLNKLMTQMELATVFLVHTLHVFGKKGATLGFVVPRSVLTADQHTNLRARYYIARATVTSYWDLIDVRPLFRVPSCVLFAKRESPTATRTYKLPVVEWEGTLSSQDPHVADAANALVRRKAQAQLIYMGERTALSTQAGSVQPNKASAYQGEFRQGATLVPRNCYFVSVDGLASAPKPGKLYFAETEPEQAKRAKKPWANFKMRGEVEGRYLFYAILSKSVLPFLVVNPDLVVLPVDLKNGQLEMLDSTVLRNRGDRKFAEWMSKVEKEWVRVRAKKHSMTAEDRLNYQNGLTSQSQREDAMVVYNASGTNLSAAVITSTDFGKRLIVDHKLYWASFVSRDEADYVCAILNADAVNDAIKPFQSTGLLGERDIHKKVLELPIPRFDVNNALHRNLATWAAEASQLADQIARLPAFPASLPARRSLIRSGLGVMGSRIDLAVRRLLNL